MKQLARQLQRALVLVVLLLIPVLASAGTRDVLFYQGMIFGQDEMGVEGYLRMTFRLYENKSGGESIWDETQTVSFIGGEYTVELGSVNPLPFQVFEKESLYLGVQVEDDEEMSPRLGLYTVPWAWQAEYAVVARSLEEGVVTGRNMMEGAIGSRELGNTGVAPGTYTNATITVDADGRITTVTTGESLQEIKSKLGKGEKGAKGDAGAQGIAGPQGPQGLMGPMGLQGPQGSKGDTGATGPTGLQGPQGLQGPKGDTGAQGSVGASAVMVGPFGVKAVKKNESINWYIGTHDSDVSEAVMAFGGSVRGVSLRCDASVTAGSLSVEATVNGSGTGLVATLNGSGQGGYATQATGLDSFNAGQRIGCLATTSSDFAPHSNLDCVCLVSVDLSL